MSVSLPDFQKWLADFMKPEPVRMIKVQDMDGRIYETDASKMLTIAPSKLEAAMANPELRKLIVLPLE